MKEKPAHVGILSWELQGIKKIGLGTDNKFYLWSETTHKWYIEYPF
jgi:hypothetical protein